MTQSSWSAETTQRIAGAIRSLRGDRSAQWLSDRTEAVGYRVARSRISDLETGRRNRIDVTELIALAMALNVAPALLVYPGIPNEDVEVLPGAWAPSWDAFSWFVGESGLRVIEDSEDEPSRNTHLHMLRREQALFNAWADQLHSQLSIETSNAQLKAHAPDLPDSVFNDLRLQAVKSVNHARTELEDYRKSMKEKGFEPLGRYWENLFGFEVEPDEIEAAKDEEKS